LGKIKNSLSLSLEQEFSLAELAAAVAGLTSGKAPGLDGLPVEFYKAFWPLLGPGLLRVFQESLADKVLPICCHHAVLTLLPKKGDLGYIKNWRPNWLPVSLLCADYKILAKVLATRLHTIMASITRLEESYCMPGRTIQDDLFLLHDLLTASEQFGSL
uniref:Reverse transcriptase domain-containing protein n=1 Tax=Crocodylus porosus TaxID=8502 RepID=A0A7M4FD05_CROPO